MRVFRRGEAQDLSLLTWNVWFGLERPHRRWTELLAIVGKRRPHVVAFQEVTDPFLDMLRAAPWIRKKYTISDPRGDAIDRYGTVVVTRFEQKAVHVHPLESEMGRKLVVVEAELGGTPWAIASVHLESLKRSAHTRSRQLDHVVDLLSAYEHVVLMGDLNFCSSWPEENARIPDDWIDVWPAVRDDEGFTVDCHHNAMRLREVPGWKRVRFDRILVRSSSARAISAELVGTEAIRADGPALFPSDHFGVMGSVAIDA